MRRALAGPRPHEWLLLAVLLFFTDRYRWLMDDAFIYFRYVDNLLFLGRGLVYNPGEYVEGYSSPLWVLVLIPLRALEIDYYSLIRGLSLVLAFGYGVALIAVNRALSPPGVVVNVPLAASAAHYGLTTHFSSGLETPLVQLLAPLFAGALLRPQSRILQTVVAIAPLVRAEAALLVVLYLPWLVWRTRRLPLGFLATAALANGGWIAFRILYYADILPNTFYLKDAAQWGLGRAYLRNVSETHHWPWVLAVLLGCAVIGYRQLARASLAPRAILLVAAAAYATYVARIGGDMLYHRYAALPVTLVLCAFAGVVESAVARLTPPSRVLRPVLGATLALIAAGWFGYAYPPTLKSHPFFLPEDSRKRGVIADPNWHRRHERLEYTPARAAEDAELRARYARLRERGEPSALPIRVSGFCQHAYLRFDAQIVHDYGLTDLVLARLPAPFGRPGHKLVQREARDIAKLRTRARGTGRAWYDQPKVPAWVAANREALALLERKLHNEHVWAENLKLAFTWVRLR